LAEERFRSERICGGARRSTAADRGKEMAMANLGPEEFATVIVDTMKAVLVPRDAKIAELEEKLQNLEARLAQLEKRLRRSRT
jgi:polyhydroxyalkanoate synthesis regulator phasin